MIVLTIVGLYLQLERPLGGRGMTFVKYWLTFPDIGLCLLVVDLHLYNLNFRSIYMAVIDPYLDLFNGCRKWSLILW